MDSEDGSEFGLETKGDVCRSAAVGRDTAGEDNDAAEGDSCED